MEYLGLVPPLTWLKKQFLKFKKKNRFYWYFFPYQSPFFTINDFSLSLFHCLPFTCLSLSLCVSVLLCLSLSLSFSLCLSLSLFESIIYCLTVHSSLCRSLSLSLFLNFFLYLKVSHFISV